MSKNVTRLFQQFRPENYKLAVVLDKKSLLFRGTVVITGKKVGRPSQRITLHQKDLKITKVELTKHDKRGTAKTTITRINTQKTFDEVRLHTDGLIYPGTYEITLEFEGQITDAMNGLYPSRYSINGKDDIILGTQFESHHAREVFPCIDEPEAKATFDLTVTAEKNDTILGNTPVKSQEVRGTARTAVFEQTPIMSTYLLAFIAGDLHYKEARTKDGVSIRAYSTVDKIDQTDFALATAVKTLEFYNDYFDLPYPLPKLDMVALPDFASGAMENWGLVTYREQCLLVDPQNTSLSNKQYVAMVVTHELAHQWFGNLVTMRWWTDLWLNEGFASWVEFMAVDHIFPEWDMWTQFIADEQLAAMRLDGLENTHPIEVPVHHPDEIRTIFDTISYYKGAGVIHMLHDYLGPKDFRDGLRHYLKTHAYKNTDTVDLWEALSEKSGRDVKAFMHAWTAEPGFPILCLDGENLRQERFYLVKPKKPAETIWPVPLLAEPNQKQDLLNTVRTTITPGARLNANRSGFYRIAYDSKTTLALAAQVKQGALSPIDRLGLLSDSFEAAKAGYCDTVTSLELLASYGDEDNAAVWDVMTTAIGDVRSVLGTDEESREAIKPFVRRLITKQLGRLGWEARKSESHFDTLLRPTILGLAAFADIPEVLAEIQKRYKAMKKPEDIEPDLRGVIWNTIARHGDEKDFEAFLKLHNESTNSEVRVTLSGVLTGFEDPALTQRALELMKTDAVRVQDAGYWLAYAFANRFGRDVSWQWLQANWDWWEATLGTDLSFSRTPIYAARVFTGKKYMDEYKKFFDPKMTPALERSIKQGLEIIQWHTAWYDRDYPAVLKFFKARV